MTLAVRRTPLAGTVAILVAASFLTSLYVGSGSVPAAHVSQILRHGLTDGPEATIVWTLRLPRAMVALVAGAGLGVALGWC